MVGAITADPLAPTDRTTLNIALVDMRLANGSAAVRAVRPVPDCRRGLLRVIMVGFHFLLPPAVSSSISKLAVGSLAAIGVQCVVGVVDQMELFVIVSIVYPIVVQIL